MSIDILNQNILQKWKEFSKDFPLNGPALCPYCNRLLAFQSDILGHSYDLIGLKLQDHFSGKCK